MPAMEERTTQSVPNMANKDDNAAIVSRKGKARRNRKAAAQRRVTPAIKSWCEAPLNTRNDGKSTNQDDAKQHQTEEQNGAAHRDVAPAASPKSPQEDGDDTRIRAKSPNSQRWAQQATANCVQANEDTDEDYLAEIERLAAQNLSEDKLKRITGNHALDTVTQIALQLKSHCQFFANLGELLPSLLSLTLDESELKSLRDLGTSLCSLRVLSLARCGLSDLDGLTAFPALRELYFNDNKVADLDPLFHHESLQVLDATNNHIATLMSLEVLATCRRLYRIELRGNPIVSCFEQAQYRRLICHYATKLRVLDGFHLSSTDRRALDDAELAAATEALERLVAAEKTNVTTRAEVAPWQEVLGSRRSRRYHKSLVNHAAFLDHDPSASALTLDQEPFSGSALAIMRRHRVAPIETQGNSHGSEGTSPRRQSVLTTLDEAREMDHELKRGPLSVSPRRLSEWQAETLVENLTPEMSPTHATSPASLLNGHPRRNLPDQHHLIPRPKSAPKFLRSELSACSVPSPRPLVRGTVGDGVQRPRSSSVKLTAPPVSRMTGDAVVLPRPLMLAHQTEADAQRPMSRRRSTRHATLDSDDDDSRLASGTLDTGPDESDDDQMLTRAAIKARATQPIESRPVVSRRKTCGAVSTSASVRNAGARLGFDLQGSLAALSQWSDAAADQDEGIKRFDPKDVRCDDPYPPRCDTLRHIEETGLRVGAALSLDDDALLAMLRQPPKLVRHLRTRDGFRRFFTGISESRMRRLLTAAFKNEPEEEARRRLEKRLALLSDVMI